MFWKLTVVVVLIAGVGGAAYLSGVSSARLKETLKRLESAATSSLPTKTTPAAVPVPLKEQRPWDGLVAVTADEREAIGLRTAHVEAQQEPIKLELTGRTAYDPDTLIKVRSRFDASVEKVYAVLGQKVSKGDRLVDLHSNDLAAAKSDYQSKYVQWKHDNNLLNVRRDLEKTQAISRKEFVDTLNDEMKSKLDYILAEDKLRVFKVPEEDIKALLQGLGDKPLENQQFGNVQDKAKITLLSPAEGLVIDRDVVVGNFYETTNVLMTIAPLDHLWVWVNVFELDQDKVKKDQTMEIQFPFLAERVQGKVQYVANEVSKDTRAVRVRASIRNPGGRLKADMLVKALLDVEPKKGQTHIPRLSMVTSNGSDYVFVRKPPAHGDPSEREAKKGVERFERRKIRVAQENHDFVVVDSGLEPGEEVATNGSLILSQLYEDSTIVDTGLPVQ
jgi:cobalt-zinc-cadmium efflux system membrane fusion protein